jgi:hypothetical protein
MLFLCLRKCIRVGILTGLSGGPKLAQPEDFRVKVSLGRLGLVVEGGGKRQSIGNFINQRLLHPIHERLMAVLRRHGRQALFIELLRLRD